MNALHAPHILFPYLSQDTCLGDAATQSRLDLPTSIKNQDSYLLTILQVSLKDHSLTLFLQVTLNCITW